MRLILFFFILIFNCSCQMGYVWQSAVGQLDLLQQRIPLEKALQDGSLSPAEKNKLQLALEARQFAEKKLALKPTDNYTSFVKLDRPYVTYVISAAAPWQLEAYYFSYPFLGQMPYKGFFNLKQAQQEEQKLKQQGLDTYVRGVSAYSTLGWFKDPILSSMLLYSDYDLVNTIIHETVHATLYIKNNADFNERLAVFLGNKGAELFYLQKEGPSSVTLEKVRLENQDEQTFSVFISDELQLLKTWYQNLPLQDRTLENKKQRIKSIQNKFLQEVAPRLKSSRRSSFYNKELNNASLLLYKTYSSHLDEFEKLYRMQQSDFQKFIDVCKKLEKSDDPELALKKMVDIPSTH